MKFKSLGLIVLLSAFAASALAQTQLSGTLKCGTVKASAYYTVEVGDHPGHVLIMDKGTCSWTPPLEIDGLKSTAHNGAGFTDVDGAKFQERGYFVITMDNGDKIYGRNQETGTTTDGGKAITADGTWSFTGGTGKLKGIKSKGTYKASGVTNGEVNVQVEGEYTLPGASATAK